MSILCTPANSLHKSVREINKAKIKKPFVLWIQKGLQNCASA